MKFKGTTTAEGKNLIIKMCEKRLKLIKISDFGTWLILNLAREWIFHNG